MKHMQHTECVTHIEQIERVYNTPKESHDLLGGLVSILKEIGLFLFAMLLLGVFIGMLFAPLFGNVLTSSLHEKKWNTPNITAEQIASIDAQIKAVRRALWVVAILAWIFAIAVNVGKY